MDLMTKVRASVWVLLLLALAAAAENFVAYLGGEPLDAMALVGFITGANACEGLRRLVAKQGEALAALTAERARSTAAE